MPRFHLVCVHPFQDLDGTRYERGTVVTDQILVAKHTIDREHHFVRVADHVFAEPEKAAPVGDELPPVHEPPKA